MTEQNYHKVAPRPVKREERTPEAEEVQVEVRQKAIVKNPKKVKKGLFERMVVGLIGPDGLPAVGRYVSSEVVGPAVKNMLVDTVINGIQMLVFKDQQPVSRSGNPRYGNAYSSSSVKKTDYREHYSRSQPRYREDPKRNTWASDPHQAQQLGVGVIIQDWAIPDRQDAQNVLNAMTETAYQYGVVKVRDYYDLIGVQSVYTDNAYGWRWDDLQRVRVRTTREGFVLDLPPVSAI